MELLSTRISQIFYMTFYFPQMLILSTFANILLLPFCYLKGIINTIVFEKQSKSNIPKKIFNIIKWLTLGPIFLIYVLISEVYHMFATVFHPFDVASSEKDRIKKYMSEDDIILFLQFIHNRSKEDRNDLHTLFIDFLLFEQEIKTERDAIIREKSYYLDKINNAAQKNSRTKAKRTSSSYFVVSKNRMEELKMRESSNSIRSNSNNNSGNFDSKEKAQEKVSGTFVKRNIIIIEIIENFLIDDGSDNYIIDIEKLKMLLPKTWNIDDSYIKRLVYTDITSVNRAVTKLKSSKNTILREQLLNKITISMIELDKSVDNDKGTQNDKNNKNNHSVKNHSNAGKINNNIHYLNNTTYGFINEEFEQKLFYENYLELLVRIAENLKMTNENNKKSGDNLNRHSLEASLKDGNKNSVSVKNDKNN